MSDNLKTCHNFQIRTTPKKPYPKF